MKTYGKNWKTWVETAKTSKTLEKLGKLEDKTKTSRKLVKHM